MRTNATKTHMKEKKSPGKRTVVSSGFGATFVEKARLPKSRIGGKIRVFAHSEIRRDFRFLTFL